MKHLLTTILCSAGILSGAYAQDFKIYPLKSSIAEETFQTVIVSEALRALGYEVEEIDEVAYAVAFQTIGQNKDSKDVYFIPTYWKPLHDNMYKEAGGDEKMYFEGTYVAGSAQGYLIDKKTAQKHNIKYYNDLKDPKIAKIFDVDGDGKADLSGCNPGWGCEAVIEHQLDAFDMRDVVEHNQGEYSAIIAQTIDRYNQGKPVLYYTWTPYWVSGKLVPGKDVVWLQVTKSAHPTTADTALPNGANYGFNVNNQHIVANKGVVKNHPDIAKLFSIMKVHVNDISAQNMRITQGEKKQSDHIRHAKQWIEANKDTFNNWIKEAKAAK